MMTEPGFNTLYEQTLMTVEGTVEKAIDSNDVDIDFESVNDILTLTCPDGSSIIITRQSATNQLWLAAKSGGFHFDFQNKRWVCDADGESLSDKLTSMCIQQADIQLDFSALDKLC